MHGEWKGGGWEHGSCALLGICSRTIVAHFPQVSAHRRLIKGAPTRPQTLGEHLRLARIDRNMTIVEVSRILGVTCQTLHDWEHNVKLIDQRNQRRVNAFLKSRGAQEMRNPTGDGIAWMMLDICRLGALGPM